jgi:hypothetical protein
VALAAQLPRLRSSGHLHQVRFVCRDRVGTSAAIGGLASQADEQVLEAAAVSEAKLPQRNPFTKRGPPNLLGLGIDQESAASGATRDQAGALEHVTQPCLLSCAYERAAACEEFVDRARRDDPPVTDDQQPVCERLDLVQEV